MSHGEKAPDRRRGGSGSSRQVTRPRLPPGPLRELKDLLYQLYLGAGTPQLEGIAAEGAKDDSLSGAPGKDTVHRCISAPTLPAKQHDVVAVAIVLARQAGWDVEDAARRTRDLWVKAKSYIPPGRLLTEFTDPFDLEVHRAIDPTVSGDQNLPVLPVYVPRPHDQRLKEAAD